MGFAHQYLFNLNMGWGGSGGYVQYVQSLNSTKFNVGVECENTQVTGEGELREKTMKSHHTRHLYLQ